MRNDSISPPTYRIARSVLVAVLLTGAIVAIFVLAPTERTMGATQRIVYVHVAVAWFALLSFVIMATAGAMYLARRDLSWDHWAQAAGELSWLCCGLTLVTGSLWARSAWGTWWTWDPRLTTSLILWTLCSGCLIVRGNLDDPHRRARVGAVLAIVGSLDIPLVLIAAHWFRGVHPASPGMEPSMRAVLFASLVGFTALFGLLLARRREQLHLENLVARLEQDVEP